MGLEKLTTQTVKELQDLQKYKLYRPLLGHCFTTIDTFSYIDDWERLLKDNSSKRFKDWTRRNLKLSNIGTDLEPQDIYDARCGYLHSQTSINSHAFRSQIQKYFRYYWGQPTDLERKKQVILREKEFIRDRYIDIDELMISVIESISTYTAETLKDLKKLEKVNKIISSEIILPI